MTSDATPFILPAVQGTGTEYARSRYGQVIAYLRQLYKDRPRDLAGVPTVEDLLDPERNARLRGSSDTLIRRLLHEAVLDVHSHDEQLRARRPTGKRARAADPADGLEVAVP